MYHEIHSYVIGIKNNEYDYKKTKEAIKYVWQFGLNGYDLYIFVLDSLIILI